MRCGYLLDISSYIIGHLTNVYGSTVWRDLLTKHGSTAFTYDTIGNTLNDGTWTYTWERGRQLKSMSNGTTTWNMTYDPDGLRTSRTDGTNTYYYYYTEGLLTYMKYNALVMRFTYDANGNPVSMTYNGNIYFYVLNLQGDVMTLLDADGNEVVSYHYDAWGQLLNTIASTTGMLYSLALYNPLRYRGYVYDRETGLNYVSSRYYNPEICRWINADSVISGTNGEVLGNNMFAYCFNNPVNMSDPTGNWPQWLENTAKVASVVVAVVAAVTTVVAVSAFTAGTGSAAAAYGATIFLSAALSGINGGVANETKGNSYINGYVGGAVGGAIQAACSRNAIGTILGGGVGVTVGTAVTDFMNNLDPDSSNSTVREMVSNAFTSGGKALVTSSLTAYMGHSSDLAVFNSGYGGMPTYTYGFGEAVKAFFGWVDDAMVYLWE